MLKNCYTIYLGEGSTLYDRFFYPAGEMQVRFKPEELAAIGRAKEIRVIAQIRTAQDIVELALLKDAIPSAAPTTLILPYLPYGRADRRFTEGDCFGLMVFGNFLTGMGWSKIVTLDSHNEFSVALCAGLKIVSVAPTQFIVRAIRDFNANGVVNILYPDAGASRRYSLPPISGIKLKELYCEKVRDKINGKLSGFEVPFEGAFDGKNVLIVDDICDGGGTFVGIADALKGRELDLGLYVTHGIFSKGFDELKKRFRRIYCTDSFRWDIQPHEAKMYDCMEAFYGV